MKTLEGRWNYLSFAAKPAEIDRSHIVPKMKEPPNLCAEWTPPSIMEFSTDDAGHVTGEASIGPIQFSIEGSVLQPTDGNRGGIDLTVTVKSILARHLTHNDDDSVYRMVGSFLPNSTYIVGSVLCLSNDLGFMPQGTSGPFVLYPEE